MKEVNPILMEFFHRSAVSNLPQKTKEVFQFIEEKEEQLERASVTEEQFLTLLIANSPFKEAEKQFSLDISTIKKMVDEAQAEIERVIKIKCERMRWLDVTNRLSTNRTNKNDLQRIFLFVC